MKTSRPGPDLQNNNLHIPILDRDALKKLSTEPNSSKFAIDAHNRAINEIRDLSEFPKLCSLDVSFNRLTSLKNIHTGKELRELKAYNNKLSSLHFLKGNGNLEGLLVQENQVDEIAEDLHALIKLKTLWLNGNRLSRVQNLGACRLLVHLDLSRNRLTGVAAEGLDNLHSLEYLNLSGNKISALGNLTHLTKLEELNLSSNRISTLEGGLLPANLTVLRLNDNQLASLQSFPPYLTKLNELYLQDNAIVEIGESAAKFPQLESLDLRNNRIRSVAQLKIGLTGCSTLVDLWIHGNPCCLSQTYLLEIVQALPELRTLESMTDTQLKAQMEALKNGVITQDALLASMARPMTPQSSRPGSASSYRPMTPTSAGSSRPATPERSVPVIHHSSTRSGALLKIASPQELEKAQADVAERLQAMKAMLGRISKGDMPKREPRSTQRTTESKARHENSFRKPVASGPETLDNQVSEPSQDQIRKTRTLHSQRTSSRGVDAGTDPLDSLMGNRPLSSSSARSPEIITPRRAMETQTPRDPVVALPPAPVAMATSLSKTHFVDAAANTTDNQSKEEINGDAIEWEMKQQLLAFVTPQPEDPDNADGFGESPRIENHKSAEQRVPPNSHSRQGYRTFRIPSRLRHHDPETAQTPANAVQ